MGIHEHLPDRRTQGAAKALEDTQHHAVFPANDQRNVAVTDDLLDLVGNDAADGFDLLRVAQIGMAVVIGRQIDVDIAEVDDLVHDAADGFDQAGLSKRRRRSGNALTLPADPDRIADDA